MSVSRPARPAPLARILGAAMTGLKEALYGPREERPGVHQDANGDPPGDQPFELLLDPNHPEQSIVIVHGMPSASADTETARSPNRRRLIAPTDVADQSTAVESGPRGRPTDPEQLP